MTRVPNWDTLLFEWAESQMGKPYVWGDTDCASLVRAACRVIFGVDALSHIKPWTTRAAALKRHSATGGVYGALMSADWTEVPLPFAQQGDVLTWSQPALGGAGVVVARQLLTSDPDHGVQLVPWSVARLSPDCLLMRAPRG